MFLFLVPLEEVDVIDVIDASAVSVEFPGTSDTHNVGQRWNRNDTFKQTGQWNIAVQPGFKLPSKANLTMLAED